MQWMLAGINMARNAPASITGVVVPILGVDKLFGDVYYSPVPGQNLPRFKLTSMIALRRLRMA